MQYDAVACKHRHTSGQRARGVVKAMKKWECMICGWIYDEAEGDPDAGIAPGTPWEAVPDDWLCPDCGASKDEFEMVEVD